MFDVDGHEMIDVAGSYGVNVAGYDRYKEWVSKGWKQVEELGPCVLGNIHPLLLENLDMIKKISGKVSRLLALLSFAFLVFVFVFVFVFCLCLCLVLLFILSSSFIYFVFVFSLLSLAFCL